MQTKGLCVSYYHYYLVEIRLCAISCKLKLFYCAGPEMCVLI